MRFTTVCTILLLLICVDTIAQNKNTDTFIRKDGIHLVPEFDQWQEGTLFGLKKTKNKYTTPQPLLNIDACEKVKHYSSLKDKKVEPFRFFRVLNDLETHDSAGYFEVLADFPSSYQNFFKGLYHIEANEFSKAIPAFDAVITGGNADSLLLTDVPFWKDVTAKMLNEQTQHNIVFAAYSLMEKPQNDSVELKKLLQNVSLPQYLMHKYINRYNYHFRKNDYEAARMLYDSVIAYAYNPKIKTSLVKNKAVVQETLDAKQNFITAVKNGLYHYEIDYLYDHLELWRHDTLTDKEFSAKAGFSLKYANKTDSIFTRRLLDTSMNETLSKFEVLSLLRTPLDKGGRRFVIVKLEFDNDSTYKKYELFLEKFKSKPIQQSVLYKGNIEGDEYMLTKNFIAALFRKDDPVVKYELSIYSIQDQEGNTYGVDTLF